jgi:hypothetical protein
MRTRRREDDDEGHGILGDGEVRRVPLYLRDGGDGWRGDMHKHFHGDRRFGFDDVNDRREMIDGVDFNRPAPVEMKLRAAAGRTMTDADRRLQEAYRDAERADAERWRYLRSAGETRDAAKAGDACTVREGGGRFGVEGSPGRLREIDGKLTCVSNDHHDAMPEPTGNAQVDAAYLRAFAIVDDTERAYEMRRLDDENAWRRGPTRDAR